MTCDAPRSRRPCSRRRRCSVRSNGLGFVQADPIRAPARAQDLTLRHRVTGYRAGDLERRYPRLDVHEDFFVNYGFVTGAVQALMHPRDGPAPWTPARRRRVQALLEFVRDARPGASARRRRPLRPRHASPTTGAARPTRRRTCSTRCTTAGCCASPDARAASASTPCTSTSAGPRDAAARRAASTRWSMSSSATTRRCRRRACRAWSAGSATPCRSGRASWTARCSARDAGSRTRASTASDWYWPAGERPPAPPTPSRTRRAPARARSIPVVWDRRRFEMLLGLGLSLRGVHAGDRSASSATTRCRCSGATASSAGATCR